MNNFYMGMMRSRSALQCRIDNTCLHESSVLLTSDFLTTSVWFEYNRIDSWDKRIPFVHLIQCWPSLIGIQDISVEESYCM
jgi:hypothetical protein